MRLNKLGYILGLAVALSGCDILRPAPTVEIRNAVPPAALLADCPHASRPDGNTVVYLEKGIVNERAVVESCDWGDKAALRTWAAGVTVAPTVKK